MTETTGSGKSAYRGGWFFAVLGASVILGMWGYVYELAYFATLKLSVHQTLGVQHFVFSGALNVIPMLLAFLVFALFVKFFSRHVGRNDWEAFKADMAKSKFVEQMTNARIGFLLSATYFVIVLLHLDFIDDVGLLGVLWLIIFFNIQLFVGALYLSPAHSKASILVGFMIAVALCFAASGVVHARVSHEVASKFSGSVLRDDSVVKITQQGGAWIAEAQTPWLPRPVRKVIDWLSAK